MNDVGRVVTCLLVVGIAVMGWLGLVAVQPVAASNHGVSTVAHGYTEKGLAAVYTSRLHGRRTASGAIFDQRKLTTAHKTLPFGTRVRLTNLRNRKRVVVLVNDRGPVQPGRIVDISHRAAQALGAKKVDIFAVKLEVVGLPRSR